MIWIEDRAVVGLIVMCLACGIATLVGARFSKEQSRPTWRLLFLVALVAVGLSTIVAARYSNGLWAYSGSTFAVMMVGVTIDSHVQ